MNNNIYENMRKAVQVSGTHYFVDDGWVKSSTTGYTTIDDFSNLTGTKITRSHLTLTFHANVITEDDKELLYARDRLVSHIYDELYGDIIKKLDEIRWHVSNCERVVAEELVTRLYNDLVLQRAQEGE